MRLERAGAALREGQSSGLPCGRGKGERAQELCESPDLWNRNLGPGPVQEAGPDLGTRGWGRVRCRPPAAGLAMAHTHSPILARLATRIHRATR